VLNRANAFTGISARSVESVLKTPIAHMVINDYRTAVSSLNSGTPFMANKSDAALARAVVELARMIDQKSAAAADTSEPEFAAAN
jgi:MinD-like ATPase involved in chromosome partitioning or flagellar assembly